MGAGSPRASRRTTTSVSRSQATSREHSSYAHVRPRLECLHFSLCLCLPVLLLACLLFCLLAQVRVRRVRYYNTFKAMIEDVVIYNLLPDHKSGIEDAVRVYRAFHTTRGSYAELEEQHGAVAIDIEPLAPFGVVDESELTPTTSSKLGTDDCKSPESSPSTIF